MEVIRQLMGGHWGVIGGSLGDYWGVIGGSSGDYWGVIAGSLGDYWGVIGGSLGGHWMVIGGSLGVIGGSLGAIGLVWFGLASTLPVVSGASLTVHARPKAWECGFVTPLLSRTSSRLISSTACAARRVPRPLLCTPVAPHWLSTCSRVGGEELNYGGPLGEFQRLQCWHVHMVRWKRRPVMCALSLRGYACV